MYYNTYNTYIFADDHTAEFGVYLQSFWINFGWIKTFHHIIMIVLEKKNK